MNRVFKYLVLQFILFSSLLVFSQGPACEVLKKTDIVFDAWRILNKAFPKNIVKRTDINSIKEILKNMDEIKKLGSYLKWKKLGNGGVIY